MTLLLPQNEAQWQKVVTAAAVDSWLGVAAHRQDRQVHRPIGAKGTLGTGWPDLVLVKQQRTAVRGAQG